MSFALVSASFNAIVPIILQSVDGNRISVDGNGEKVTGFPQSKVNKISCNDFQVYIEGVQTKELLEEHGNREILLA